MWIALTVTVWLFSVSIMDIRDRSVPVWVLALGGVLAVLSLICQGIRGESQYIEIVVGLVPGVILLLVGLTTHKTGYGDGIAMLFLGMATGGGRSWLIFGLSLFCIGIFSLALLVLCKAGRNTKIPYLPFLTAAWLLAML